MASGRPSASSGNKYKHRDHRKAIHHKHTIINQMKRIKYIMVMAMLSLMVCLYVPARAQFSGSEELGSEADTPPGMGDVPVDGGLSVLLGGGAVLGYRRLRKGRKK
jgi:hypothetical protein